METRKYYYSVKERWAPTCMHSILDSALLLLTLVPVFLAISERADSWGAAYSRQMLLSTIVYLLGAWPGSCCNEAMISTVSVRIAASCSPSEKIIHVQVDNVAEEVAAKHILKDEVHILVQAVLCSGERGQ